MSSPHEDVTMDDGPRYEIGSWSLVDGGFDLGVRLNGKRFSVAIRADHFQDSPAALEGFHNGFAMMKEGNDQSPELWNYLEWIVGHFLPQLQILAPPVVHTGPLTLAHLVVREVFECEFHVVGEQPVPGPVTRLVEQNPQEFDARTLQTAFLSIDLTDVEVPYEPTTDIFSIVPQHVLVHGLSCFYKSSLSITAARNEIGKHDKIVASDTSPSDISCSRLHAIVVGQDGRLHGLIYHFIESDKRLTWAVNENTPLALREKWAAQIKETVDKLHRLGVTWGDVKADNVLIDKEGDAVLIGLGGGTTQGWVDVDKGDTVEGDLQGLEKMKDFIFNDESVLRPRGFETVDEPGVKVQGH